MLDRHAVQELLRAGLSPRAVARQFGVSRRTIERIGGEAPIEGTSLLAAVGRSRVDDAVRARVGALVLEDPERAPPPREDWKQRCSPSFTRTSS